MMSPRVALAVESLGPRVVPPAFRVSHRVDINEPRARVRIRAHTRTRTPAAPKRETYESEALRSLFFTEASRGGRPADNAGTPKRTLLYLLSTRNASCMPLILFVFVKRGVTVSTPVLAAAARPARPRALR